MLLALLLAASSVARPFNEERLLLDRRLETLRRILPDGPNPAGDAALIHDLAEGTHLLSVEALARPPIESGARGDVLVDVSGFGRYAEIDRFFRQVALSHRLLDVESLTLTAAPGDAVRMMAVIRVPFDHYGRRCHSRLRARGHARLGSRDHKPTRSSRIRRWPSRSRRRSPPCGALAVTRACSCRNCRR